MSVLNDILRHKAASEKMLAVLLDPEKLNNEQLETVCGYIRSSKTDFVFVGGSGYNENIDGFIDNLRYLVSIPIVLFPGTISQFSPAADALLFLSLLSCRDAELIVGKQISAAMSIKQSGIETIPTGYILVDGGRKSTTQSVTGTDPLRDTDEIIRTAVGGELLGKQLIYLEAGSGAKHTVSTEVISLVKDCLDIPLIVGGGIRDTKQITGIWQAGADLVVVGNHFETHPEDIPLFANSKPKKI